MLREGGGQVGTRRVVWIGLELLLTAAEPSSARRPPPRLKPWDSELGHAAHAVCSPRSSRLVSERVTVRLLVRNRFWSDEFCAGDATSGRTRGSDPQSVTSSTYLGCRIPPRLVGRPAWWGGKRVILPITWPRRRPSLRDGRANASAHTARGRDSSRVGIGFLHGDASGDEPAWPCMHSHQHAVGSP